MTPNLTPHDDPIGAITDVWNGFQGAQRREGQVILQMLLKAYEGSPDRAYHNVDHLALGLKVIKALLLDIEVSPDDRTALLAAWLFHDFYYDVTRKDNEAQSAIVCAGALGMLDYTSAVARRAHDLIVHTAKHRDGPKDDPLWQIMNDADLAIFGSSAAGYFPYARSIWSEYRQFGEDVYRKNRLLFLNAFLKEARTLFLTEDMEEFHVRAERNILDEIDLLENAPGVIFKDFAWNRPVGEPISTTAAAQNAVSVDVCHRIGESIITSRRGQ